MIRACFVKIFFCAIMICSGFSLFAQNNTIPFKHLSVKEGLPQNPIFVLMQDRKGFVWIGGQEGLIRYDGYEFKKYTNHQAGERQMVDHDIRTIYEDQFENLWIGTFKGLFIFDRQREKFVKTPLSDGILASSLQADGIGNLWVGTRRGLRCLEIKSKSLKKTNIKAYPEAISQHDYIERLFLDKDSLLWLGINKGIKCIDLKNNTLAELPEPLKNNADFLKSRITVIRKDFSGNMWFGTDNSGVFRYDPVKSICTNYTVEENKPNSLLSNFVRDIHIFGTNQIWLATRGGLSIFNKKNGTFTNHAHDNADPNSLSHNNIRSLMKDKAGNIWLATYAGGINIFNSSSYNFLNIGERIGEKIGLNVSMANAIIVDDSSDILWVGTEGGGLNYVDRKNNVSVYYTVAKPQLKNYSNIIKSMAKDGKGNLLLGMLEGLAFFNTKNKSVSYFDFYNNPRKNIQINAILSDKEDIWIGTNEFGLKQIKPDGSYETFMPSKRPYSISNSYVNDIVKDDQSNLWLATRDGLNQYNRNNKQFVTYYIGGKKSRSNLLTSLYYDDFKRLWIGAIDGLYLFDTRKKQFHKIRDNAGFLKGQIQSIRTDRFGAIWVSTLNGINKIAIRDLALPLEYDNITVDNYTVNDGLLSNQFLLGSVAKNKDGKLFFGGVNGVTEFYPDRILKNKFQPNVVVTEFTIHNQTVTPFTDKTPLSLPIENTEQITLTHDQGNIAFRFAALNFTNPQNNQYAYKLEGLRHSEDWQYIGNQRTANFLNLDPGNYRFLLKATNNDGLWSKKQVSINIRVLPPFWKTWSAYLIYMVIISLIVYQIVKFLRIRSRLKYELYMEHLENKRQKELHQLKLDFFTNVSHEIRTPLTLISGPLENLIEATPADNKFVGQQLKLMKNNADRLLKLMSELLDFRKAETGNMKIHATENNMVSFLHELYLSFYNLAVSKNITFDFICKEREILVFFDTYQLEKVVFNLLANAFKFTPDRGKIALKITQNERHVEIEIADNGIGIAKDKQEKLFTFFYQAEESSSKFSGTGIGLALSKSIIELHKGEIKVDSSSAIQNSAGYSSFCISLKKGKDHFDPEQLSMPVERENTFVKTDAEQGVVLQSVAEPSIKTYDILLVEDNRELREFLRLSLSDKYNFYEAVNGEEGLNKALELIPDLIISDVMMPEMDGLELTEKLKTDERTSHIPVILLTAKSAETHQIDGLETGADLYITKPFKPKILELQIKNLLITRDKLRKKFNIYLPEEKLKEELKGKDHKFMEKVLQFIDEHMSDPEFGVAMLTSEVGMSQPVLYKKIKALTDLSVNDFIKSVKLKKASILLRQKELTVYEISYAVGFSDTRYFSREFAKQFGKTPTAYKANLVND